ncbi:hypothetical protein C1O25_01780 [Vibrio diazotrophicus]|uniref:Uncharacterized protein n=1 Tax=Vibrio diazotrophicus TaxID=685 RepID=A0ABX4WEH7_VIBDI|nr:hypothetical protein C1O25_01780 [Vibrio diazotrophicus]
MLFTSVSTFNLHQTESNKSQPLGWLFCFSQHFQIKKHEFLPLCKSNKSVVLLALFDHKHASLFKKKSNDAFQAIYSKKLLTLRKQIRIMRTVLSNKAT